MMIIDHPNYIDHLRSMLATVICEAHLIPNNLRPINHMTVTLSYCFGYLKAFERAGFISQKTYDELVKEAERMAKGL